MQVRTSFPPWIEIYSFVAVDIYQKEMQHRCEELRLCEGSWKANQIAYDYYWSWRAGKEKSGAFNAKIKAEEVDAGNDNEEIQDLHPPTKRLKPTPVLVAQKHKGDHSDASLDDAGHESSFNAAQVCVCSYLHISEYRMIQYFCFPDQ